MLVHPLGNPDKENPCVETTSSGDGTIHSVTDPISVEQFRDDSAEPSVRGFLHLPANASADALVLTHGAGANCQSKLLTALANSFAEAGFTVLRCDLPFRQVRPFGPPSPGSAARGPDGVARGGAAGRAPGLGRLFPC